MEDIIITLIWTALEKAIEGAAEYAIKYIIRKVIDETGRAVTQILYEFDSDGDGVNDSEQVIYTLDTMIPDLSAGYCLCNDGDKIGIGLPQFTLIDGLDIINYIDTSNPDFLPTITGNGDGYLVDADGDGDVDDVLIPFDFDVTGDGSNDWGWLVDDDNNGVPDASPDAPFYPVGSPEYHDIVTTVEQGRGAPSIIIMSADGTMTVYDMDGNITAENCDTAYSLWVSENGIMDKPIDYYSVTEGLLLLLLGVSVVFFIRSLFKRKDVYR